MAISVRDANNDIQTVQTLPAVSRAAAAASLPVTLSTEDKTSLDAITTKLPAVGTAGTPSANVVSVQGVASGTVIPISDGGGSLTVDGTVAVTGTFWQATQPVSGTFWQATQPVSIAALPALATGANAIGSITNTGFVSTGNVAHDAADSGNPVKIGAKATSAAPSAVASGDRSDLYTDTFGSLRTIAVDSSGAVIDQTATVNTAPDTAVIKSGSTSLTPKFAVINLTATNDLVAAVPTKKIRVTGVVIVCSAALTVTFTSGTGPTAITGPMAFPANGGMAPPTNVNGLFETVAGAKLAMTISGTGTVAGWLTYIEV